VALETTSPVYVYLLRAVLLLPRANIPKVVLPAAEPPEELQVEAVAEVATQLA
jgi:hypothetical protein